MSSLRRALVALVVVLLAARTAAAEVPLTGSVATAKLEPLVESGPQTVRAGRGLVALPVPGFGDAVVSLPLGSTEPRPLLLATHGNYDRPEWQCEVWREIVADSGFVLCPRGVRRPDSPSADDIRFTYTSNVRLEQEIAAGIAALKVRFPGRIDDGPVVYTGFSLGAIMGVAIMARRPERYRHSVLTEGGFRQWTAASARAFGAVGKGRILFACGQGGCVAAARRTLTLLKKHGAVPGEVVSGGKVGHSYDGPVARAIAKRFAWLVEEDPRWRRIGTP